VSTRVWKKILGSEHNISRSWEQGKENQGIIGKDVLTIKWEKVQILDNSEVKVNEIFVFNLFV